MAYVPPALRKKAQCSAPNGTSGTTAEAAGSHENLPPDTAPPGSIAGPTLSQADIHHHYWPPRFTDEGPSTASMSLASSSTLNASAQAPDKLKYIMLFGGANPRWCSHGIIFVKSKLHILPGGEKFKDNLQPEYDEEGESPGGIENNRCGSTEPDQHAGAPTGDHAHVSKGSPSPDFETDDEPKSEQPYSPDLSLYDIEPIAVFEQVSRWQSGPFRFAGYYKIASLEYLAPHSRELFQLLEQKFSTTDRFGRIKQRQRSAASWRSSMRHRWAVISLEKDEDADANQPPPNIEAGKSLAGDPDTTSARKSVNELLKELRMKD